MVWALEHALELGDPDSITDSMRNTVEGYNRDDCVSTQLLRDWLEQLRAGEIARGEGSTDPTAPTTLSISFVRRICRFFPPVNAIQFTNSFAHHLCFFDRNIVPFFKRQSACYECVLGQAS